MVTVAQSENPTGQQQGHHSTQAEADALSWVGDGTQTDHDDPGVNNFLKNKELPQEAQQQLSAETLEKLKKRAKTSPEVAEFLRSIGQWE